MNESREEEKIVSAFRAGWEAGKYYERNPHTSAQLKIDADNAVQKYLESLPADYIHRSSSNNS